MAAAVFSSNIEGNSIDLNSYQNYRQFSLKKPGRELLEIDDLVAAYEFARANPLTEKTFLAAHKRLAKRLVIAAKQGKYRLEPVGVFGESGLIYLALEPLFVADEMAQFFTQLVEFQRPVADSADRQTAAFFQASWLHLRFVHIHPFADGNGRAARLLEKWFLAEALGPEFWQLQSEKNYRLHQADYYRNIDLGVNFHELNYDRAMPFLAMLPDSLTD